MSGIAIAPFTLNTGANSISTTNVSDFSDWAVGNVVPIVSVSGRVTNSVGRGIKSAAVSITDSLNVTSTVRTDAFGRYSFQNVGRRGLYYFGREPKIYFCPTTDICEW
ncbi:MAG: carboxypeptidase regulatory-like domain-containing protein [Chloracidobacterium sp.]|nr:carboxypeptidase regulatory-like domain-containing protein [Chloracidobacterium sp.]